MTRWGLVGQEGYEENREWSQHHRVGKQSGQGPLLTPGFSAFATTAVTTGSATKETRPFPESDPHLVWALSPPAVNRVFSLSKH